MLRRTDSDNNTVYFYIHRIIERNTDNDLEFHNTSIKEVIYFQHKVIILQDYITLEMKCLQILFCIES